jgi:hypothetical protein
MNECISNRHESDLGGRFLPFESTNHVGVTIVVAPATAHRVRIQHTAWMLVNLLARLQGVVHRIAIVCPANVPLASNVVPFAHQGLDLQSALFAGAAAIGIVPINLEAQNERTIVVGPGGNGSPAGDLFVYGNGWWGGASTGPIEVPIGSSSLPFGPYIAACIAVAEIFKAARIKPDSHTPVKSAFYSAWYHRASPAPLPGGPSTVELSLDWAVAGIGAVGSAFVHALWACEGLCGRVILADYDPKGLEATNLNRYPLFGSMSVDRPKASEAARIANASKIVWLPYNQPFETLAAYPPRVISAVDKNTSRAAIQNRYFPRVLSGSTRDLRAEILRCGPPGVGACLRCFNPPVPIVPDDHIRNRVRLSPDEDMQDLVAATGLTLEEIRHWAQAGGCATVGDRVLSHFRAAEQQPREFAVGFVSVLAGTVLAAEAIKDEFAADIALSNEINRAVFQFWSPLATSNGASILGRDPSCPMCAKMTIAADIWAERFHAMPARHSAPTIPALGAS